MYKEFGNTQKKKILRNANFLDLKPLRKYPHEMDDEGNATVLIPRFTSYLGKRFLQPRLKHPYIKLSLDEPGTQTWLQADGKTTVRDICQNLKTQLGDKIHPAEERVTRFFSQLYMRKLITFTEILKK